jgi:cytochrome c554/c'-like protein
MLGLIRLWRSRRTLTRGVSIAGILVSALLGFFPAWLPVHLDLRAETKEKPASEKTPASDDVYLYMGAASCSGSACHGSTTPRSKLKIAQNEFYIWSEKDDHTKAYDILTKADSKLIAKNLKIAKPEESERCLVCHATSVSADHQGSLYDVTEGVTCEGCHGPAERWLGPHIRKDFDPKKATALGMYPTKDLAKRAEKCLECHAGAEGKTVDHELIGAGHPRLSFELDNYSHAMPAHWLPPKDKQVRDWLGTRAWAISQAVGLRNEIKQLMASRRTRVGLWPDLTHFDCFACHHSVVDHLRNINDQDKREQRWRNREYDGKPGRLVWNSANYTVFRHVVHLISSEEGKALDAAIKTFHEGLTGKGVSAESFAASLGRVSELSDRLVSQISQYTFTQGNALALMRNISGDGRRLAAAGFQSAEQAVFALASLYDAYLEAVGPMADAKGIKETIDALYKEIEDGRSFNPAQFETTMNKVHRQLAKSNSPSPGPS